MLYGEFNSRALFFAVITFFQHDLVGFAFNFEDLWRFGHAYTVALTEVHIDADPKGSGGQGLLLGLRTTGACN